MNAVKELVIVKYPNRKLYITKHSLGIKRQDVSSYTTLSEIVEFIKSGFDVRIYDFQGSEITSQILAKKLCYYYEHHLAKMDREAVIERVRAL